MVVLFVPPQILNPNPICVFSSHSFWTSCSLDVIIPAGVTAPEEGHTEFFVQHLPCAVHALIFLARRIHQPFLSHVDHEVEFLCTYDFIVLHLLGIFISISYI